MRKYCLLVFTALCLNLSAQDTARWSANIQLGADLMSRYIWRGINLGGNAPAVQPVMKLNVGNETHLFTLGAWGSYSFSNTSCEEMDLFASYTFKNMFTVMVTDYFFPGAYADKRDKYFYYRQDSTGHVFEGCLMFNGTKKVPVTFMACVNFYGNDARRMKQVNDSTFEVSGLQYSTYFEIGYKTNIKGIDFNAFVGGTLTNPDTGRQETGYYMNTKAGFTNVGIKVAKGIPVSEKYSLPIQVSLIANPLLSKMYLVFGISF